MIQSRATAIMVAVAARNYEGVRCRIRMISENRADLVQRLSYAA